MGQKMIVHPKFWTCQQYCSAIILVFANRYKTETNKRDTIIIARYVYKVTFLQIKML